MSLKLRQFKFGSFTLNPEERVLLKAGKPVKLAPRTFDLLCFLVANNGRLIRKDEIIREVWKDSFVEEGNIPVQVNAIRKALDDETGVEYIEAVAKNGYRFADSVVELSPSGLHNFRRRTRLRVYTTVAIVILLGVAVGVWRAARLRNSVRVENDSERLYDLALSYEKSGDDELALNTIRQSIVANSSNPQAYLRAAFLSYDLEDNAKARGFLDSALKYSPSQNEAYRLKAQALALLLSGDFYRSLDTFKALVDEYPSDMDALYEYADLAREMGNWKDSENALATCLKIDAVNPFCNYGFMLLDIDQGRFDAVIQRYERLHALATNYLWYEEAVGISLFSEDRFDDAKKHFDKLGQGQHQHGTYQFTLATEWDADILLYQGHVSEAKNTIQRLMETSDNVSAQPSYLIYLAQIDELVGDLRSAEKEAEEAFSKSTDPAELEGAAVILAFCGGHGVLAKAISAKHLANSMSAKPATEHFIEGMSRLSNSAPRSAVLELSMAHQLDPGNPEISYWLARAEMESRQYHDAIDALNEVLRDKGRIILDFPTLMWPLAHLQLSDCYRETGDKVKAQQNLQQFLHIWRDADPSLPQLRQAASIGSLLSS